MEIAELGLDDFEQLVDLWQRAGLPFRPHGRDSREAFSHQLENGAQNVLGMFDGEKLVAAVTITHDSRKGWINRLAVDPPYRRQGFGKQLIAAAENLLHRQGIEVIAALIYEHNSASRAIFAQAGYLVDPQVLYYSKRDSPTS